MLLESHLGAALVLVMDTNRDCLVGLSTTWHSWGVLNSVVIAHGRWSHPIGHLIFASCIVADSVLMALVGVSLRSHLNISFRVDGRIRRYLVWLCWIGESVLLDDLVDHIENMVRNYEYRIIRRV